MKANVWKAIGSKISVLGVLLGISVLSGCIGIPEGIEPVSGFEVQRYEGKWYEIARLDHSFERGLESVTATYTGNRDNIEVLNKGYDVEEGEWSEAIGKAVPVDAPDVGHLKVSFFGPFYSSYVVFHLKDDYSEAYVSGMNKDYLWYLSRSKVVTEEQKQQFIDKAKSLGFEVDQLIWVNHSRSE